MTKWPKNPNIDDIYTNPNGLKWRWNGKGWSPLRRPDDSIIVGPTGPPGPPGPTGSNISGSGVIFYQFSHGPMDPIDSSEYYIGNIIDLPAQSGTSVSSRRVKSLISGTVDQISIMTQISGVLGTSEYQQFKLNNFTTGSYSVITSTYSNVSASMLDVYSLNNPLVINEGDELEIIWSTPVFSTSPTILRHYFNVYIEY